MPKLILSLFHGIKSTGFCVGYEERLVQKTEIAVVSLWCSSKVKLRNVVASQLNIEYIAWAQFVLHGIKLFILTMQNVMFGIFGSVSMAFDLFIFPVSFTYKFGYQHMIGEHSHKWAKERLFHMQLEALSQLSHKKPLRQLSPHRSKEWRKCYALNSG